MDAEVECRPVVGFPDYMIGRDGKMWKRTSYGWRRVFGSVPNPKNGYRYMCLSPGGVKKLLSHIVLEAFVGPRPEWSQACHFPDSNPSNNRVENLRWGTAAENAADKWLDRLKERMRGDEKFCMRCKQTKPVGEFMKNRLHRSGRGDRCRACRKKLLATRNSESGG